MSSRALYIGRFQPFHLGHLNIIEKILAETDRLIIGIGSAEDNFLPDNPFTCNERYQMIEKSLDDKGLDPAKYTILPVRNINNYALWVEHISLLFPPFDTVYTGSPIIKQLIGRHGKFQVKRIEKEIDISATEIRKKMLVDGNSWEKLVPKKVAKFIKKIEGLYRIQHLGTA